MDFWEVFWLILIAYVFFACLMLLFSVFGDIFRDHELGGWAKALWTLFIVVMPFLGVLVYLIARGPGMAQRSAQRMQEAEAAQADYIRSVASNPAEQVGQAKQLLDSGAITQQEFESIKAKTLATT